MKAVALVSGGLDSTVMAYWLKDRGYELTILAFNYGQRHGKEVLLAQRTARVLNVPITILDLRCLGSLLGTNSLTSLEIPVPEGTYAETGVSATLVPNRNAIFLTFAYALAYEIKAEYVAIAAHAGDADYPDCSVEFLSAFQLMEDAALGVTKAATILAPFAQITKTEIVQIGTELEVPFKYTWSCYKGGAYHCGACPTCRERMQAFKGAQVDDPTQYEGPWDIPITWKKEI